MVFQTSKQREKIGKTANVKAEGLYQIGHLNLFSNFEKTKFFTYVGEGILKKVEDPTKVLDWEN